MELVRWGANAGIKTSAFLPFQLVSSNDKPFPNQILHRAPGLDSELFRTHLTDIHSIASQGNVKHLLAHRELKKCKEACDSYGETPLHYAARCGQNDVIDVLLSLGCQVDCVDNWGFSPLHCACEGENCPCFFVLVVVSLFLCFWVVSVCVCVCLHICGICAL
jgi:ankyrin repeat protein